MCKFQNSAKIVVAILAIVLDPQLTLYNWYKRETVLVELCPPGSDYNVQTDFESCTKIGQFQKFTKLIIPQRTLSKLCTFNKRSLDLKI